MSCPAERLYRVLPCGIPVCSLFVCCTLHFLGRLVDRRIERVLDTPWSQDEFVSRPAERLDIRFRNCAAVSFSAICCLGIIGDCCQ